MQKYSNLIMTGYLSCTQEVTLSDMRVSGVELAEGTLTGLGNLARWGSAGMEMRWEEGRRGD